MKHIVFSVTRKTAYLLSALVILTALAIIVLGIITPYLDKHLPDIEAKASAALELPVKIEKIRLSWYKYEPEISLNHVTVLSKDNATPLMQIDKVRVFISIPKSLWQRQPVFAGLMVSGSELEVKQNAKGEFVVQGFPAIGGYTGEPFSQQSKFSDVVGWLSSQPEIILQDVDIRYTGMLGQKRFVTLYNLGLQNNGQRHTILGRAILHQDIPTNVTLAAQWLGNVMDYPNIQGKVYAYVSGLSLNQWWKGLTWQGWQLKDGYLSAKIWGVWNNGEWQRVQTLFTVYDASLFAQASQKSFQLNRISGDLGWKQVGNQQIIAGDDILLDLPKHLWPATSFYLRLVPDAKQQLVPEVIKTGYLNIVDVLQVFNASPGLLPANVATWVNKLAPQGDILHLQLSLPEGTNDLAGASFNAAFSQLQVQPYQTIPGVKNLTGSVQGNSGSGQLLLESDDAGLTLNNVFSKPVKIGSLQGDATWEYNADKVLAIKIPSLVVNNDDIALHVKNGSLQFTNTVPTVDLEGDITVKNAAHIAPYFPMKVFDQGLQEWLSTAFLSGRAEEGTFILKGDLKDYPFDKNNGQFFVNAHVKDLTLRYAPAWPVVEDIDAQLTFKGREMMVALKSGRVMSIPVSGVLATIPSLGGNEPAVLSVTNIKLNTDFANGLAFVHQSPLEKNIGRIFKDADVSGNMNLNLALTVPLDNPDNTQVDGQIALSDALLNLTPWRLAIKDLTGVVNFTEKSTDAPHLTGKLFDQPLSLALATIAPSKGEPYVQATVDTHFNLSDVQDWLHLPLAGAASGGTDVSAVLNLAFDQPLQINLKTDLKGIAIKAPTPYGKTADAVVTSTAEIQVAENQPLKAKISYGDLMQAAMLLKPNNDKFDLVAANVMLGKGDPAWPVGSGLTFTANFDKLDWAAIQSYQSQMSGGGGLPANLTLNAVNINVNTLSLFGQTITNAAITAKPVSPNWLVNVNSNQITGSIRIPMTIKPSSEISANLTRVNLSGGGSSNASPTMKTDAIPALNIAANNVRWNGMALGDVSLVTAPTSSGLVIKQLNLNGNGVAMTANGMWTQSGSRNTTHLVGQVTATQLSQWIAGLGVDAHNLVATKGQGGFNLTWNASPADIGLANMNGNAMISLGAGRIVDVADTNGAKMDIGKMLSIFSLQTIPRRLSLDFSDVFQKGYSFDSFKGDFVFNNGNAVTHNTRFDGPVAKVGIDGAIGLATKTYDFTLSVTPYVTSSIPVAAAIISGPVAGIAALAVNKIISSSVAQATTYYYAVGGTWAKPTWGEVKKR